MKQHKFTLQPNQGTAPLQALIVMFAVVVIVALATPILSTTSTSAATSLLENSGHVVMTPDEYTAILSRLDDIRTLGSGLSNQAGSESSESFIFPESTGTPATLTAGPSPNTLGNWAEIHDGNASTLSSRFTADGFICEIIFTNPSAKDKRYAIEIACGSDAQKEIILRGRTENSLVEERSTKIPAGSTLYYRAMCEKANATIEAVFRYHYYPQ